MSRMYLSGVESVDAMIPRSLHALLDNISLLCATIGEPTACEGCQNLGSEFDVVLFIPRERIETLRPVGPRWRKTYAQSVLRSAV